LVVGGASSFHPAGVVDSGGVLHAIWYDTSGPTGRVLYAHTTAPDYLSGFSDPIVVDGNACPGNGWAPGLDGESRRLREYVDLAVDNGYAYLAWTHAPNVPTQIYVTRIDY
jgi:hypothetical protein